MVAEYSNEHFAIFPKPINRLASSKDVCTMSKVASQIEEDKYRVTHPEDGVDYNKLSIEEDKENEEVC